MSREPRSPIPARAGGAGEATVLLVHGLGVTARVWDPLTAEIERDGDLRWIAPDLPGHGAAGARPRYSLGSLAAEVAEVVPDDGPVCVVGHSLGGPVGLALASGWFGVRPAHVVGIGIKVEWSAEDLERTQRLAAREPKRFDDPADARELALRSGGLAGLLSDPEPFLDSAVTQEGAHYRLTWDNASAAVGEAPMAELLELAKCPVVLACGSQDPMVDPGQLEALHSRVVSLDGLGHNAHVEAPANVWQWVRAELAEAAPREASP